MPDFDFAVLVFSLSVFIFRFKFYLPHYPFLSPHLYNREMEVLRQLSQGHVTKIIARNLDLSVATVKFHLGNIYKKLGVSSQKLALAVAREKHLI